jgi:hypothetical protein
MLRHHAHISIIITIYIIDDLRDPVQCMTQSCQYPNILK